MSHEPEILAIVRLRLDIQELLQRIEDNTAGEIGELTDAVIERVREVIRSGRVRGREVELIAALDALIFDLTDVAIERMEDDASKVIDLALALSVVGSLILGYRLTMAESALVADGMSRIEAMAREFNDKLRPKIIAEAVSRFQNVVPESAGMANLRGVRQAAIEAALGDKRAQAMVDAFANGAELRMTTEGNVKAIKITLGGGVREVATKAATAAAASAVQSIPLGVNRWRALVLSEYGRVDNDTSIAFAQAHGVTRFENDGVIDERQAPECWYATVEEEPLTIAEWKKLMRGDLEEPIDIAPRHPNCRCWMIGVPDKSSKISQKQIEEAGVLFENPVRRGGTRMSDTFTRTVDGLMARIRRGAIVTDDEIRRVYAGLPIRQGWTN